MDCAELYIDLLKKAVRNELYRESSQSPTACDLVTAERHLETVNRTFGGVLDDASLTPDALWGIWSDNSPHAHTLCTGQQLDNVRQCIDHVIANQVPGDLIETGVFRGGQTVFMRGVLKAKGVTDRRVFVADSFEGLPPPDPSTNIFDAVAFALLDHIGSFRVTVADVKEAFARYDLLDDQVVFLEGWFKDSLPSAPLDQLAVMRLDGDFYESTADALESLYPKLSVGGFVIIDDYGLPLGCRAAVDEYRAQHSIREEMQWVGSQTVFWQRAGNQL